MKIYLITAVNTLNTMQKEKRLRRDVEISTHTRILYILYGYPDYDILELLSCTYGMSTEDESSESGRSQRTVVGVNLGAFLLETSR